MKPRVIQLSPHMRCQQFIESHKQPIPMIMSSTFFLSLLNLVNSTIHSLIGLVQQGQNQALIFLLGKNCKKKQPSYIYIILLINDAHLSCDNILGELDSYIEAKGMI